MNGRRPEIIQTVFELQPRDSHLIVKYVNVIIFTFAP